MADGPNAVGTFLNETTLPGTINTFDDAAAPKNELLADGVDYRDTYYQESNPVLSNVGLPGLKENSKGEDEANGGVLKGTLAGDVWENGYGLYDGLTGDGSVLDKADAIAKAATTASDVKSAVTMFTKAIKGTSTLAKFDPFNFLGAQLMSWMLEHVEPLRKTLESLTGSPDMVQAYSDSWGKIATHLEETAKAWAAALDTGIGAWTGAAAEAYRATATDLTGKIAEKAALAQILSDANGGMKRIVEAVKAVVTEVLTTLAGMLAEITAILIASAGTATPALISRALFGISSASITISQLLIKMAQALVSVKTLVHQGIQVVRGVVEVETAKA
ncbi:hypothetical protein ACFXK0_10105 [Nocardia sp. NPDC059177]|uniref:hypothetical protein n=1 Tax=Nocardia sp. NPDC059177 TaxID=3346759 RepID=UPI00368EF5EB